MPTRQIITDEALIAFIQWARVNDERLVTDPEIARRVFNAYRLLPPSFVVTPEAEEPASS